MRIKLRKYDTVVYTEEKTQEVRYIYSIDDSTGLLEIYLTLPEEADPVESFVIDMKNLYRGLKEYIIYYKNYKYRLDIEKNSDLGFYLTKIQMY